MRGTSRFVWVCALLFAVLMVVLLPGGALAAPSAQVVGTGEIRGTVRDTVTGQPILWNSTNQTGVPIAVEVWRNTGGSWEQITDEWGNPLGFTAENGTYSIPDVPIGTYYLRFIDFWGTGYRDEFYNNAYDVTAATPVVVTIDGVTTANISLVKIEIGTIAGTITDATSGAPADEVYASVYALNGFGEWDVTWWGAASLSLGDWRAEIPAGQYKIEFTDYRGRFLPQFYGGGTDLASAPLVTVAPTHTTPNINAAMVRAGHISGIVTGPGGVPLKGIYPLVFRNDGSGWGEVNDSADQRLSAVDGTYDVGGLRAGTYRLVFFDPGRGAYIQEAWNNVPAPSMDPYEAAALGTNIVVPAGGTVTGRNAELTAAGRISGTIVESGTGDPVSWAAVEAYDADGVLKGSAWADQQGQYVLGNLGTGNYKVKFVFDMGNGADWYYAENWYSNQPNEGAAGVRAVAAGEVSPGTNATLVPTANWGRFSGVVRDETTSKLLPGIRVALDAWYDDGFGGYWVETDSLYTDTAGEFAFKYVPVGDIQIRAEDTGLTQYGRMYEPVTAGPFTVTGGSSGTTNILLAKPTQDMNGSSVGLIHGSVTNGTTGIAGAPVSLFEYDDFFGEYYYSGQVPSNSSGEYVMPVPVGTYVIGAGPAVGYVAEYYVDAASPGAATKIGVTAGSVKGPYAMTLGADNKISGTVRDGAGQPLEGAYVSALRFNADWNGWEQVTWEGVTNALTAADGTYTLHGLPAGTYKVAFYGPWEGGRIYGARWWRSGTNAQSIDQAGTVTLAGTGSVSAGKDAVLTEACMMRGAVTDQDGNRATGIKVKLWWNDPVASWAVIQSSYAYHDGDFAFEGFTGGEYRLEFLDDENYLYAPGWYRDVADLANAEEIVLTPGQSRIIQQVVQATNTYYSPVFGTNRILTAISASQLAYADGSVTTVVIATGFNWPDALGGAALAGAYDGPILLTDPTVLPWQVADEIERLGATDAIILGGTSAVSGGVESSLKSKLGQYHVRRIGGANRYETANLVAAETVARLGAAYDGTAFVATGLNFPDALGASPLAASASWPIYLTDPAALTPASKAAMLADGVTTPLILGETGAVSADVEGALDAQFGATNVIRLGGATRYETAVKVAQYGVDHVFGLGWNNVAIATGQNYPDALAGGVLQGKTGSVLLLTPTGALDATVAAKLTAKKSVIVGVRYLGGPNAVSEAVRTQVQALLY